MATDASGITTPPVTPPGQQTGDKGGKTYTEDEVTERLRGQGKALKDAQEELDKLKAAEAERAKAAEEASRKKLEDDGKLQELIEAERKRAAELEGYKTRWEEHQQKETARLEALVAENKKRKKALSEEDQALVPDDMSPDSAAEQITRLEIRAGQKGRAVEVRGTSGRGKPGSSDVDPMESGKQMGEDWVLGKKKKDDSK
jgi:hypothetical protein